MTDQRKAAWAGELNKPLEIVTQPLEFPDSGAVCIKVKHSLVRGADRIVLNGWAPIKPPVPFIPGVNCVGEIVRTSPDVHNVKVGDIVLSDAYLASHYPDYINNQQRFLLGLAPVGPAPSLDKWKNGSWTSHAVLPAECVHVVPSSFTSDVDLMRTLTTGTYAIGYGALVRGGMSAGKVVIVCGASGHIGSATVQTALMMGARKVYAVGRKIDSLKPIIAMDPYRILPVVLDPSKPMDEQIKAQVTIPVDLHVDFLGYTNDASITIAAMSTLRVGATSVFAGGVDANIPINYGALLAMEQNVCGSFMYSKNALSLLMGMMECKQIKLDHFEFVTYPLDKVNEAMETALQTTNPFKVFVLTF